MSADITRRDFIDGVATTIVAGAALPGWSQSTGAATYPPGLGGMRGSREQDYAAAHALRDGQKYRLEDYPVSEQVDCLVVGAGISGLSAAYFLRQKLPETSILILDNHDDFGGHARRNEFEVDGRKLIGYGGSESIQSPKNLWSPAARGLLTDLGVDLHRFETAINTALYPSLGLSSGMFFSREAYGQDKLVTGDPQRSFPTNIPADLHRGRPIAAFAADCPLTPAEQRSMVRLWTDHHDPLAGMSGPKKLKLLDGISYPQYLERYWHTEPAVVAMYTARTLDLYAEPANFVSALDAAADGYPGFQGLQLPTPEEYLAEREPYIHHFPDGNASIARLLVRRLIPDVATGHSMEDVVTAPFAYQQLDRAGQPVRLRLSSTVVLLKNAGTHVDALYVRDGKVNRCHCRHVIYAGYFAMLPYVCQDLPPAQRDGVAAAVRVPLVYVNVALRNWRSWVRSGVHYINCVGSFYCEAKLDYPVSLGHYQFARTPDDPILVHLTHTPQPPAPISDRRAAARAARAVLYSRPFADFEIAVRDQLTRMLGAGGFDADRDIAAITVNRWGHGYACYLSAPGDPEGSDAVLDIARKAVGRISLAGSDAGWDAFAHVAIDEAHRAAAEVAARAGATTA
ncbi:MAG TPA: NAD(P)-binding protein [Steroidobacteraceae bacterium]